MKERHWNNLVTSLRHRRCTLVVGPDIRMVPGEVSQTDSLMAILKAELEEDGHRVTATTLAGIAQQYEDVEGFGPGALRSQAAKFYASHPAEPSPSHMALADLPFPLVLSTCHDRSF